MCGDEACGRWSCRIGGEVLARNIVFDTIAAYRMLFATLWELNEPLSLRGWRLFRSQNYQP